VKLPGFARLQPYALAGGGALVFDPTGNAGGNFAGATTETRGAFVYGAGADYAFTRHISLRAEYRGYVYKAPDLVLREKPLKNDFVKFQAQVPLFAAITSQRKCRRTMIAFSPQ
jgi:opacity protein-like surface antigen